jgi:hypothetical protein
MLAFPPEGHGSASRDGLSPANVARIALAQLNRLIQSRMGMKMQILVRAGADIRAATSHVNDAPPMTRPRLFLLKQKTL